MFFFLLCVFKDLLQLLVKPFVSSGAIFSRIAVLQTNKRQGAFLNNICGVSCLLVQYRLGLNVTIISSPLTRCLSSFVL